MRKYNCQGYYTNKRDRAGAIWDAMEKRRIKLRKMEAALLLSEEDAPEEDAPISPVSLRATKKAKK